MSLGAKMLKKRVVAARLESYHKGYCFGFRFGAQKAKPNKLKKKVLKGRKKKSSTCKKQAVAARLEAHQRGYHLGIRSGVRQEQAKQVRDIKAEKAATKSKSRARGKRLAAARLEAYLRGVRCGAQQECAKQARIGVCCSAQQDCAKQARISGNRSNPTPVLHVGRPLKVKSQRSCKEAQSNFSQIASRTVQPPSNSTSAPWAHSTTGWDVFNASGSTSARPARGLVAKTYCEKAPSEDCGAFAFAVLEAPTPMRKPFATGGSGSADACRSSLKDQAQAVTHSRSTDQDGLQRISHGPSTITTRPAQSLPKVAWDATFGLRSFLKDPAGLTREPGAFQLRCVQICQKKLITTIFARSSELPMKL